MNESLKIAEYIYRTQFNGLPSQVAEVTKKALLDGIGVVLGAGTLGEGCRAFVELARKGGGTPESTVLGFGIKVPSYMAAFANGSMAHALDFEDAHEGALVHSNAAVIPAALAIAESIGGVAGTELITALTLGSDLVCRLGLALKDNPLDYGWYTPAIVGAFGATAAASKLLNLSADQILDALSLCLCQATCTAEIVSSPQSCLRAVRDSFAAKTGVLSALLAKEGVRGFDQPIEGKAGFYSLYARGNYDADILLKDLGQLFESANIVFKNWPSCRATHAYIEGSIAIIKEHRLVPADIKKVTVVVEENALNKKVCEPLERKRHPDTAIDAKFSIPFTVAVALVHGEVTLDHFSPSSLQDRDVLHMAEKVTYEARPSQNWKQPSESGYVEAVLTNGEIKTKRIDYVYGHANNPMDFQSLVSKFKNCASYSEKKFSSTELDRVVNTIMNLENVRDTNELTGEL